MKTILAIDDADILLDLIQSQLSRAGFSVYTANSPELAKQLVSENDYDLILLDIMMPNISGFEVLEFIKKKTRNSETPVVMLSAREDMNSIQECLKTGAQDYITKPFKINDFKKRIMDILNCNKQIH